MFTWCSDHRCLSSSDFLGGVLTLTLMVACSVTAIAQSSVVDVLAVGFESGAVKVHDMKQDQSIVTFDAGAVSQLGRAC